MRYIPSPEIVIDSALFCILANLHIVDEDENEGDGASKNSVL